ncbi:hypothetical protein FNJ59_12275 [Bacteroides pyogenes]|uniref:hypothetical protein n=1 Tax=Bacteroides pyogenes TaxID=310300 RepID=UPI0011E4A2FF|nr:hypothetical protein [Bacteroides pyogenes]TYK35885.1 hypothetical protein FNJ59_12275 [Bacteroides pyogenes]
MNKTKSHANRKFAWLLFFVFERAGDQRKEAKESRRSNSSCYKLQKEFIELNVMPKKPKIVNTALMNDIVPTTNLQVLPL